MTSLVEQLEQMRIRMNELSKQESTLVATLADGLREADHQLLQEVRRLTADHEERRATILGELQALASRLNGFPSHSAHVASLGDARRSLISNDSQLGEPPIADGPVDWEQRSANIRDALNSHLGRRALAS